MFLICVDHEPSWFFWKRHLNYFHSFAIFTIKPILFLTYRSRRARCGVRILFSKLGLFLFIFVLLKHKLCRKTVCFNGIWTWMVGVKGLHTDHLTITTAHRVQILWERLTYAKFLTTKNPTKHVHTKINKIKSRSNDSITTMKWPIVI